MLAIEAGNCLLGSRPILVSHVAWEYSGFVCAAKETKSNQLRMPTLSGNQMRNEQRVSTLIVERNKAIACDRSECRYSEMPQVS